MKADWNQLTAAQLAREIADEKIDAVELCKYFLNEIETHSDADEIYVHVTRERALREAAEARARARYRQPKSPLDGVPVSWKDLFDTKGDFVQSGSALLNDRVANEDARVVELASNAGMVCLGKTHQTELAFSGLGINPNTKTPPNRDFSGSVPGGSSSGAAASVAFGLVPIAVGSDTGGSVRIPACWNSLVGHKTTYGAISRKGVVPLCSGFDTVGPLAKSVEDAALIFEILGGEKVDLQNLPEISDMRFVICESVAFDECETPVLKAFEEGIENLAKAGVSIERKTFPQILEAMSLAGPLFTFEAWREWGDTISAHPGVMYAPVEERFRQGAEYSQDDYAKAKARLRQLREDFAFATFKYDAVLTPTTPLLPPRTEPLLKDSDLFTKTNLLALRNTRIANLFGACALTLPLSQKGAGLQLIGKPMKDARLLQIGAAIHGIVLEQVSH